MGKAEPTKNAGLQNLETLKDAGLAETIRDFVNALENDVCPYHREKITKIRVGKCVYAKECGCRLYRGKI